MLQKRFILTLGLLTLTLSGFAAGMDAALDRLGKAPTQNSFVVYDDQGHTLFAYSGDLNACTVSIRPTAAFAGPRFLHRT
jgi:hypothetical protein